MNCPDVTLKSIKCHFYHVNVVGRPKYKQQYLHRMYILSNIRIIGKQDSNVGNKPHYHYIECHSWWVGIAVASFIA